MKENLERSIRIRPQPIGIYSGQASCLLLPSTQAACRERALARVLNGGAGEDFELPPEWSFFRAAVQGRFDDAVALLQPPSTDLTPSDERLRQYNLWVMQPSVAVFESLHGVFEGCLAGMLEVAAYNAGIIAKPPSPLEHETEELDGELLAWCLASSAASELERESFVAARQLLETAVGVAKGDSPILAAMLLAQSAQLAHHCLALPATLVRRDYETAIEISKEAALPGFLAELWTQLGMLLQASAGSDREQWLSAVRAYQAALQSGVSPENQPALYAELHNNLGLAYLAMPASDSSQPLRTGVAIQSFRHALEPLDPVLHGDLIARVQMNLANALQYAPSSHPESNLVQAVQIYDEVLEVRTRAREPIAYALVLLNQANALAHLGIFKPSLEKASEAYKLFQWYNQPDQAASARELVERVNDSISGSSGPERSPSTATV